MTALLLALVATAGLAPGTPAPDFTAQNQDGKTVKLADFKGKPVLIYFYPKDDTPGCTKEACTLRNDFKKFQQAGAVILGVSKQDAASHRVFKIKYHLPFDLIADTDGRLAKAFRVDTYPLIGIFKRQSVLLDGQGKVVKFFTDVDPEKHSAEVLALLAQLKK